MSSNLKVNTILPSAGTAIGIGTAGGNLNVDGGCKVQVGPALTLGHTQGLQFHTQNLHAQGFEVNQVNASGIITATGADINGDIDVDGHTNLDNVSIAGVTTITGSGNALEIVGGLVRSRNTAAARFVANNGSAEGYFGWSSGVLTVGQAAATLSLEATSSNHIQLKTNGSERLRIKSNGNIVLGSDGTNSELTFSQDGTSGVILYSTTTGFGGYNTFTVNSAQFVHKYGGNERLRIASNGAVVMPDSTQGLRFGSATSQDFALYHSGSNSHIDHFGTGNLYQDFNNDFHLRFYRSAGDVREALTVLNGVAANPEFIIKSNPTSASTNSGTHSPAVRFKGAGWNTNSGSVEVGTKLQSEHHYWSGSYSNVFGQTYPDFKIMMKNSDSGSYHEKFVFSGDGKMRLISGGGINFHNYGSGSNISSNTLDDYEEGTHSTTDSSGAGLSISGSMSYTKIGRLVHCLFDITYPSTSNGNVSSITIPFAYAGNYGSGLCGWTNKAKPTFVHINSNGINFMDNDGGSIHFTNDEISTKRFIGEATYFTNA